MNLENKSINHSINLLIELKIFELKNNKLNFTNKKLMEHFKNRIDNEIFISINKVIYNELSKNKGEFLYLTNNFIYSFNSENWTASFENILNIANCSLLLQSVNHSMNCMSFISETIMPRLTKIDNFINIDFTNFTQ